MQQPYLFAIAALLIGLGVGATMGLTLTSSDPAPQTMADQMAAMNAGLVGKTGDDFDRAFIAEMIPHHQGAIAMAELAIAHANHPKSDRWRKQSLMR